MYKGYLRDIDLLNFYIAVSLSLLLHGAQNIKIQPYTGIADVAYTQLLDVLSLAIRSVTNFMQSARKV